MSGMAQGDDIFAVSLDLGKRGRRFYATGLFAFWRNGACGAGFAT